MAKFSVKRPFIILVAVLVVTVLGIAGFSRMTTDFLPEMEFPYMVILTTYTGASPQKIETDITDPVENGVSTINGVKNVTSTSSENYSSVTLEFEDDTNMDSAMVKVTSALNQLDLPEQAGDPMVMEVSMDMMPTVYTSVDMDGKKGNELSDYVNENVIPEIKRQDGVATVQTSGMIEDSVEVKLDQKKIDDVNTRILEATNKRLAKARKKLDKAEKKLDEAEKKIKDNKKKLDDNQNSTSEKMAAYTKRLNQAIATEAAYDSQLQSIKGYIQALKMEKKAYTGKNGVVEIYSNLNKGFSSARNSFKSGGAGYLAVYNAAYTKVLTAAVQNSYKAAGQDASGITDSNASEYLERLPSEAQNTIKNTARTQAAQAAGSQSEKTLSQIPESVEDAVKHKNKFKAYKKMLESQGQKKAASQLKYSNLSKMQEIVSERIPQVDSELANLNVEKKAAEAADKAVKSQISRATDNYEKVEAGKMTAAAGFGAGQAGISSGEQTLKNSRSELKKGKDSYEKGRKAAIKASNLDSLLTINTLSQILTAENFSMPAGYINDDKTQYLLKISEEDKSRKDIADTLLTHIKNVGDIRLKDVARVTVIDNSDETYAKVNGNDAVVLAVYKSSSAGTSAVADSVIKATERMSAKTKGLHFTDLMDQGQYIKIVIDSVFSNLIWGAVLAIIVLFLFLRDIKPTLVVALSIPLSVIFTIFIMFATKMTLNIISLSGIALGIGMLVDNSIVVIENIYRLRAKGISAARAAVMGANQVAGAIFSSTLTTICVFLPIIFTDGLTRQIMQDMCLTITYSLLASLIVAMTVVPCLGNTLLKKDRQVTHKWFEKFLDLYQKALTFCLDHKAVPILLAVALLAVCAIRVFSTGIVTIPEMGSTQLTASVTPDADSEMAENFETMDDISEKIRKIKGVKTVGAIQATSVSGFASSDSNSYTMMIILDDDMSSQNKKVAAEIEKIMSEKNLKDYTVSASTMDTSALLGSGLQIDITGNDDAKLLEASNDIKKIVRTVDGFKNISNGQEDADKQLVLDIDKDKAMRKGLTVAQVAQALATKLTKESKATEVTINDDDMDVTVKDETNELTVDRLKNFKIDATVTGTDGKQSTKKVRLGDIADYSIEDSVASISHDNGSKIMSVTADTKDGYNTTLLSRKVQKKLDDYKAPSGCRAEIKGESENTNEMMKNMLQMMLVALILIYLIMLAQFANFLSPFIVMFTIPLAFTGGFIALMITGQQLSMLSMMGFLILMGVVVNNGIVLIDYVNQLRKNGSDKRSALIESGRTRMRPVLMSSLTTVFGMLIMALSHGQGAEMGRGMAIVVIGGLLYATLMTLFIVPVLYDIFNRREIKKIDLGDESTLNAREGEEK